jgi:hypothetical protein
VCLLGAGTESGQNRMIIRLFNYPTKKVIYSSQGPSDA